MIIIVAVTLLGSCYDSFDDGASGALSNAPLPNITIGELHELLQSERFTIYDDMVVEGTITSTDRYGNFYKTFVMEYDGHALEVMEGMYDSYTRHDVGNVVVVKLKGLAMSRYRGVLQLGLKASEGSYYMLDYLSAEQVIDNTIFRTSRNEDLTPYVVDYESLNTDMCGRLVTLKSLHHTPAEDALQPYTWTSYQQFVDNFDNSIYCYTSDYANFSQMTVPSGEVSLSGILQWGSVPGVSEGKRFIIEMRSVEDCSETQNNL